MKYYFFVDVSPLWELEYTGVSNVVYEIARRIVSNPPKNCEINFTIFDQRIDMPTISKWIKAKSGLWLQEQKEYFVGRNKRVKTNSNGYINNIPTVGLFLHNKPATKIYSYEGWLFYDLSFILTPECHTKDTIQYHTNQLDEKIKTTDIFFTISESTKNDLLWLYDIQEKNCHVALLGASHDPKHAIEARNKIGTSSVEPFFLVLGTIEPRKNIGIILAWISKNIAILEDYKFVFAGRQGWGKQFNEYILDYGLASYYESKRIIYFGYVDEKLKSTLLVAATAVIYPSFFEGFGLPVLEAMSLEVPVIASCSTSIPEVLGDCGYYFNPYSIESLDKAVKNLISDSKSHNLELIRKAAKKRADLFSYDQTYEKIITKMGLALK